MSVLFLKMMYLLELKALNKKGGGSELFMKDFRKC